jgi:tRNA (guanine37-N1)-methyltransferase
MRIDIITLFTDMFKGPFDMSMLWKAQDKGLAEIVLHDLRDYGIGDRRTVDDTPYGGGDGMLLKPDVVVAAIEECKKLNPDAEVIVLSPQGKVFNQEVAQDLAGAKGLILIAGHYEGFDERIIKYADRELSIGDYVLTGGELPAMVLVDAVVRLLPGVLGGEQSAHVESFSDGLLEYPQYTRPVEFRGDMVPEVLQNGHHAEIEKWRNQEARNKTRANRPDLFKE